MRGIKRLDAFVIKGFLGPLVITYFICLFIFLMQTLWRYVSMFVGKGLDQSVILQFFYYSSLSLTPMALPLAILLAALMVFGDMGEHLELLSMKTSGVSLFRIMSPLFVIITIIAVGAFFFSNEVLPWSNNKMNSLLANVRNTKPELEIPENQFYDAGSFVMKVESKDKLTGMLHHLILYDHTGNQTTNNVTYADSGRLDVTNDKRYMVFTLFHGKTLANFQWGRGAYDRNAAPFRRDEFGRREILADVTGGFEDKDRYSNHATSMNIQRLTRGVDSLDHVRDSSHIMFVNRVMYTQFFNKQIPSPPVTEEDHSRMLINWQDSIRHYATVPAVNPDSFMHSMPKAELMKGIDNKIKAIKMYKDDIAYTKSMKEGLDWTTRMMNAEWHQKLTLPFACIVFFFIGAPLGAIIRKGGLGMPVVISVVLFIVYYIINNTGSNMAKEGKLNMVFGMWLSSIVLLPFGILLTYKAAHDSAVMNKDTYEKFFKKIKKWIKKIKTSSSSTQ